MTSAARTAAINQDLLGKWRRLVEGRLIVLSASRLLRALPIHQPMVIIIRARLVKAGSGINGINRSRIAHLRKIHDNSLERFCESMVILSSRPHRYTYPDSDLN